MGGWGGYKVDTFPMPFNQTLSVYAGCTVVGIFLRSNAYKLYRQIDSPPYTHKQIFVTNIHVLRLSAKYLGEDFKRLQF